MDCKDLIEIYEKKRKEGNSNHKIYTKEQLAHPSRLSQTPLGWKEHRCNKSGEWYYSRWKPDEEKHDVRWGNYFEIESNGGHTSNINNPKSNKINNKTGNPNVKIKTKAELKQFNEQESGSSTASNLTISITSSSDSDSDMEYESHSDNEGTHKMNDKRPATRPKSFILANQTRRDRKIKSPPKPKRRRQG